jgi:hypothetical protein
LKEDCEIFVTSENVEKTMYPEKIDVLKWMERSLVGCSGCWMLGSSREGDHYYHRHYW